MPARGAERDQRGWAHLDAHPVAREHIQRALGDVDLPERGGMDMVGHHQVAGAPRVQVHHQRTHLRGHTNDHSVQIAHLGAGARAAQVERGGHGQHPVAARAQELQGGAEGAFEGHVIPLDRPHVIDADVQATELIARARLRALHEGRNLLPHDIVSSRSVHREGREWQAEPACHPERPRLQRDAPLQFAAAVGDRVAEGENSQPALTPSSQDAREYPLVP